MDFKDVAMLVVTGAGMGGVAFWWRRMRRNPPPDRLLEAKGALDRIRAAAAKASPREGPGRPLVPIDELGERRYKGEAGGLYGGGSNDPPSTLRERAAEAASEVLPRNAGGVPGPGGRVGLLCVGMSNTAQEFERFAREISGGAVPAPGIVPVNGAQPGRDARAWAEPDHAAYGETWGTVDARLAGAGVAAAQVQVAWIKQAVANPAERGEFPGHVRFLEERLRMIVGELEARFRNLALIFVSSRTYAGFATGSLNPEPYAYESAFAVRRVVMTALVESDRPVILWGPYLWAGTSPRSSDGLAWNREDFGDDGTHPSGTGEAKVARLLESFFSRQPWFTGPGRI